MNLYIRFHIKSCGAMVSGLPFNVEVRGSKFSTLAYEKQPRPFRFHKLLKIYLGMIYLKWLDMLRLGSLNCLRYLAYITNLLGFIVSYKICAKFGFHMLYKSCMNFMLS